MGSKAVCNISENSSGLVAPSFPYTFVNPRDPILKESILSQYILFMTPSDNVENSSNVSPKSMNLPEYFDNLVGSGTRVSDSNLLTPIKRREC